MDTRENVNRVDHKLYKQRWFMLGLFMIYAFNGAQQWAQFTIINNLVTKYYNVSATQVEWTANIFTLMYIILVVPSLYLIDIMGVRYTMVLGALGITIGNWIKVFSVAPDRFYMVFVGQSCSASFLMLTYGLTGRFTALWFGADEISTAGVMALLGDQLGTASAFFLPSLFVKDGPEEEIGNGMRNMHLTIATTSTAILLLILLFFKSQPKLPPSVSQIKQQQSKQEKILKTLTVIFKKRSFILFMLSYGLNVASYVGIATLLNELVVGNFPGAVKEAGNIGSLMMISGMISSLVIGKVLDRTRVFKESAVVLTTCSVISMILFTWSLKSNNILYVYATAILLGFSVTGYYSTGIQLGIELTYPIPEQISTAITFLSGQVFSFILTVMYGYAIKMYGDLYSNIGILTLNIVAVIAALCVPSNLKRQQAENEPKKDELKEFI